jgi:hypothetical protein
MKSLKKILFLVIFIFSISVFSQEIRYASILIPKELKENANAVIRNQLIEVTIEATNRMVVYEKKVVTVLNKLGNVDARIAEGYDNNTKITKLSAKIYDALGNEIKKFRKGNFKDISAVSGGTLYSDSKVKYIDYTPISYPYTLVFESEYKTSSTGFIPKWFPINGYYISVQKSQYKLNNPLNITVRTKKKSFKNYSIKDLSSKFNLNYSIENQLSIKRESYTISSYEFLPYLLVGLNEYALKDVKGKANNWKEFGKWRYDYLKNGNDQLKESVIRRIQDLTKNEKDPIEKAKIVYKYMQDKTRYISVQEGIGGWKPIPANKVDEVGYGDCKGLTNYTKTLLDAIGVESHYSVIWAGNEQKSVEKDFFGMQGNHVILNIPNNGNDIWLECTSQTMPFGFLGNFTDDRNVLVITPKGGIIKRTPAYINETNLQAITCEINLFENGDLKAKLKRVSTGIQYDDKYGYKTLTKKELIKYYKSKVWGYNNNLEIDKISLKNDKENVVFTEDLNISIRDYATINNTEFLFRVNVFNKESSIPKRYRNRQLPLKISRGYKDVDEVLVNIPKNYRITVLPEAKELKSKFGSYKISFIKIDENSFKYKKVIIIKEGLYPKEDYKLYRKFRKNIVRFENIRIALTKK